MTKELNQLNDKALLSYIQQGNEMALANLYDRYWDMLFISAYKVLKDEEACKDIVQELFISIWENDSIKEIENVKAYLYNSVRYRVLMVIRKGKVRDKHLQTIRDLSANTTEDMLNFEEMNERIDSLIRELPDKCQQVFRMSRVDHLTNKEIAVKLNISIRTVETHISNGIKHLKTRMDSYMVLVWILIHFD
ncbi:RNA polymerase sigma-70 factor [Xanthovirga aplysinae]|uniref:RNA polymerase sigma-70 factor n=1 Tax=Xanthovirga aplysinae TaxID=2529853 RepID=UPI0012BBE04F|nr:RNA polymerase sigma-70 factor [Xanthovirga aplysinae]MTI33252.1 RNA polymerase sigma-70 factor [Xanthovirga aplysinae]